MKKTKTSKCLAKQTKGITLIALVITIVVLLILAAVSITAVFGDNGLLQMAKEAADKTNEAVGKEQEDISELKNFLENQLAGGNGGVTPTPTPSTTPEGKPLVGTLLDKRASDTNQEVQDKNGKPVVIPAGFTIVPDETDSVEYADPESPTVDDGIVIEDGVGNQFVWVPVENPAEMYGIIGEDEDGTNNYAGKLYDFKNISSETGKPANLNWKNAQEDGTNKTEVVDGITVDWIEWMSDTDEREPDTVNDDTSNFNSVKENGYSDFKAQLQKEFNDLVDSVNKYKGFYIGRYETSGLKNEENPIVQAGQDPTVKTNWYTMYKNSKEIGKEVLENGEIKKKENSNVTSSMIWGSQWDAVMNWFLSSNDDEIRKYVTDSSDKGVYGQSDKTKTGSNSNYAVKNIYDMAGNVWEWTIEADDTDYRVFRGGNYSCSSSNFPASLRNRDDPTYSGYNDYGSRATLYVNL